MLGQAYVRFTFLHDCDNLISNSPHAFGDVNISFVKHNRGRNWRSVHFNRECWLMLLGFPVDYWEQEFLDSAIPLEKSFLGKKICPNWHD